MKPSESIKSVIDSSTMIMTGYLGDFTDADIMVRPAPNANHTAWQMGHLITSEFEMMEAIKPGMSPKLPAGFVEAHSKEAATISDPKKFLTKQKYLDIFKAQRNATLQILESLSDSDLDKPTPEKMRDWAPTWGNLLTLVGTHMLMHVGQVAIVRRLQNKPILM